MGLLTLEQLAEQSLANEKKITQLVDQYKATVDLHNVANNLWYDNEKLAFFELSKNNIQSVKYRFFNCGWLDEYCMQKKNTRFFDYGLHHISYAILSDSEGLIHRYTKLRYQRGANAELSMDEMVEIGELPIWCNTVQFFMANNIEGVERKKFKYY